MSAEAQPLKVMSDDQNNDDIEIKYANRPANVLSGNSIDINDESCCSRDSSLKLIECISLITLNILVVLWYDKDVFNKSSLFWCIFVFGYISSLDALQTNIIILILLYVGQYILYLFVCDFTQTSIIAFTILICLIISCGYIGRKLIYSYCVNSKNKLIWRNVYNKASNEYKCCKFGKWWNTVGFLMLSTTVPIFYFNQS